VDCIFTNATSSCFVGNRRSSKRADVQQSMRHSDKENNSAAPKKRKLEEMHVKSFACGQQALSERSADNNHCCNEETVSWQQTKADDGQRPKVGLLQRIQERRQEAENRQRREDEQQKMEVTAKDEEQKKEEAEGLRKGAKEEQRQEAEKEEQSKGHDEQRHQSEDTRTRRGVIVRLHDLESAPQLNGSLGLCLYQGEADRWVVHLDSEEPGRFRNVRQQNLEFVCCGGAVQPMIPQQDPEPADPSEACENSAEPPSDPAMFGKRKHGCQDVQLPLAERFAELEREQLGFCDAHGKKPTNKFKLDDRSQEISARSGAGGLVEDILEMPDEAILKRLMLASMEDLTEVVSPEAMAYIVLARTCRTRTGGG